LDDEERSMNIKKVLQSGGVVRYHNHVGIDKQPLSSHQWGVALIVQKIYPICSKELLLAALTHDASEYWTGDVPAPVKWSSALVKEMMEGLETMWNQENGIDYKLSSYEGFILKLADMFEGMWFCIEQLKMGNLAASRPFRKWKDRVEHHTEKLDREDPIVVMYTLILEEKAKWTK
jgi:5'-deoxynucleotidase YfbR-like HD superfamily hydrolase